MVIVNDNLVERISDFLEGIGIAVAFTQIEGTTFLPGLQLQGQCILVDHAKLKYPGDLLHEAGHIAVTKPELRSSIGTDKMVPDWPTLGDEIVAILWSYAALHHLELDPKVVFHADGYRNSSSWFIEQFTSGTYMGLPLLTWMGFCDEAEFPKMKAWLR